MLVAQTASLLPALYDCVTFVGGGSVLAFMAWSVIRCPHRHELFDRYPDGRPALRCQQCLQLRPNILGDVTPRYRQTQQPLLHADVANGIKRTFGELDYPITDADLFDFSARPQEMAAR
ncbi:MAG: hypothetical protein ACRD1C_03280 [Terriglobales bacterium]